MNTTIFKQGGIDHNFICIFQKLRKEFDQLEKQLAQAKKQLEDETMARVDLENRMQSLKEELAFKQTVHDQVQTTVHSLKYHCGISNLSFEYTINFGDKLNYEPSTVESLGQMSLVAWQVD